MCGLGPRGRSNTCASSPSSSTTSPRRSSRPRTRRPARRACGTATLPPSESCRWARCSLAALRFLTVCCRPAAVARCRCRRSKARCPPCNRRTCRPARRRPARLRPSHRRAREESALREFSSRRRAPPVIDPRSAAPAKRIASRPLNRHPASWERALGRSSCCCARVLRFSEPRSRHRFPNRRKTSSRCGPQQGAPSRRPSPRQPP